MQRRFAFRRARLALRGGLLVVFGCVLAGAVCRADTVTQVLAQPAANKWTDATDGSGNPFWSNGLAPSAGNDYVVPGSMTLRTPTGTGSPDFPGASLTVSGGTLALKMNGGQDSFVKGDLIFTSGNLAAWQDATGGALQILDVSGNTFRADGNFRVALTGGAQRRMSLKNATLTGGGNVTVDGDEYNDLLQLEGTVSGNGHTGNWAVNNARLVCFGGQIGDTSRIALNAGAYFDFRGNETIGSIEGSGTIQKGTSGGATLLVGNDNTDTLFSGAIVDGSGTVSIEKRGTGTLTLTGASSHTGNTTIYDGYLKLGGSTSAGGSTIHIDRGETNPGTLVLYNGITVNNALTVAARHEGAVQQLVNESGSNTLSGNITWNAGGAFFALDSQAGTLVFTADTGGVGGGDKEFRFLGDGDIVFSGAIGTTAKAEYVTKNGNGTAYLLGGNLFKGTTTLKGGTLAIAAETGLGTDPAAFNAGQLTFQGGALRVLETLAIDDANRGVTLGSGGGTIQVDAGKICTISTIVAGGNNLDLTKTGDGTLVLEPGNTYMGKTIVQGGVVEVSSEDCMGANPSDAYDQGQLTLDGGTLHVTESFLFDDGWRAGTINAGGGTIEVDAGKTLRFKKTINGAGRLVKTGEGTLITERNNGYSGGTLISAGILQAGQGGTTVYEGTLGSGDISNNATLYFNHDFNPTVSAKISGTGTLIADGDDYDDTLTLSGANDYTGPTIIAGGVVDIGANGSAFGTSAGGVDVQTKSSQAGIPSPTLQMGGATVTGEALTLNCDGTLRTRLLAASGANVWSGPITLVGDGSIQINVDGSGATLTLSGGISGVDATTMMIRGVGGSGTFSGTVNTPNATFFKTDAGDWTITSTGNDWAATQVADGTLRLGVDDALPTDIPLVLGQGGSSAVFDMAGFDQTVAGLEVMSGAPSSQTIGNSSATDDSLLTFSTPGGTAFAGRIWDVLGSGSMRVALHVAMGTLTLSGTSTYTGPTTVDGALLVSGAIASVATVHNGAVYGGGGTCGGLVVDSGGTHAPGASIGTDTVSGDETLAGTLEVEVDGSGAGSADRVNVTGTLTLDAGSTLEIVELAAMNDGVYILAQYGTLSGTFGTVTGLPDGYAIDYAYGTSGDQIALVMSIHTWDGEAGASDRSWATGLNWAGDTAPPVSSGDGVVFQDDGAAGAAGAVNSELDQNRVIGKLTMTNSPGNYHTIDLKGYALDVGRDMIVGDHGLVGSSVMFTNSAPGGSLSVSNGVLLVGHDGGTTLMDVKGAFVFDESSAIVDIARRDREVAGTPQTTATLDLSDAPSASITAAMLRLGTASQSESGNVRGILRLPDTGAAVIDAETVVLGDSPQSGNTGAGTSEIHFGGGSSSVTADEIYVGYRKSVAMWDVASGGTVTLAGKSGAAVDLYVGDNDVDTGTIGDGNVDMSGGTFNATLGTVVLGHHPSGSGAGDGRLTMSAGTVTADSVTLASDGGSNPQNTDGILTLNGGTFDVSGSVTDAGGTSELAINDGEMTIADDLTVDRLYVGQSVNNPGSPAVLTVGGDVAVGTGSEDLWVARNVVNGRETHGLLDLSGASSVVLNVVNLYVGSGSYQAYGDLKLSESGSNAITAGTITIASVDPQGNTDRYSSLVAGGISTIDADMVYIGRRKSMGELTLTGSAALTMGATGDRIGSLRIGFNDANTGANGIGILNGANGTLVVYADAVVLGRHDRTGSAAGSGTGRLYLDSTGDVFDANTVVLGHTDGDQYATATGELHLSGGEATIGTLTLANAKDGGHATGTVNLSGGALNAMSIKQGDASGTSDVNFNWTGGMLSASSVDLGESLVQAGGTLAPGGASAIGRTVVTGGYTVNAGHWAIELDGTGAGANDTVIVSGTLNIAGCTLDLTEAVAADDSVYVIAQYGTLSGTFAAVTGLPADYSLVYGYGVGNQIALVRDANVGAAYRMRISFENYDRGDVLTDFPALVVVSNAWNGFYYDDVQPGGTDVRFAAQDGATALDYEVESWGIGSERSYVWVKVPEFSAASYIWMYWGNGETAHAPCNTNGAVWTAGYEGVWHLNDDAEDATANGNDATAVTTSDAAGVVARGETVAGGGERIDLPPALVSSDAGSMSMWVKTTQDFSDAGHFFWAGASNGNGFGGQNELHVNFTAGENIQFWITGGVSFSTPSQYADGVWHYVAATWDRTVPSAILYVDGSPVGSSSASWNSFAFNNAIKLGRPYDTERYYTGDMDDVRLAPTARSANWLWTEWKTVADNAGLMTYGSAERFVPAQADAYIRNGTYENRNYGGAADLLNKTSSSGFTRKTYLRFDVSGLPAGANVNDASLQVKVKGGRNTYSPYTYRLYGLNDGDAGESWIEGTLNGAVASGGEITWATAPGNDTGSGYEYLTNATLLETYNFDSTMDVGSRVVIDSGALRDFLNRDTDGQVTLMLSRTDSRDDAALQFYSKEGVAAGYADAPTLGYLYTTNALDEPLFRLDADTVLRGSDASVNTLNAGASAVLTNLFTDSATARQFSVFRFSRIGELGAKTFTFSLKLAGGTGAVAERPKTFYLWGLTSEGAEHWIEGTRSGTAGEGDEATWATAPQLVDVYHAYPDGPVGNTANNRLLVTITRSALADGSVLTFEGNALDAFVHASEDSVVSFAVTQSDAGADDRGWDFYARESTDAAAQAATLTAHDPRPTSIFLMR